FHALDLHDVRDECGVQLDGQTWRKVDTQVVVRKEHAAVLRQNPCQHRTNQFGVRIVEIRMDDLPYFRVGGTQAGASRLEFCASSENYRDGRGRSIDLARCGRQFDSRVVDDAIFMCNVSENSRRHFRPPLAAMSSSSLSTFSSRLPVSISAPLPSAGMK